MSKITLATTTKTKQNPKSTRLYILGHLFLYIYLQSFFSLFFRGCRGVCYLGACWTLKKKFVDFVKVRVLELCTLSRAPPFFSVHFFLWRNFQPFVLVTTTKKILKKSDSKIFIVLFSGHLLFFIYLFSFLRGGGWVGGWEGMGLIEHQRKEYIS